MPTDKHREAQKLAHELLQSVGLTPSALVPVEPLFTELPVERQPQVSLEEAFEGVPVPDRTANAIQRARAQRMTGLSEEELRPRVLEHLSKEYGVPAIHLREFDISPDVIALIPRAVASTFGVIPLNLAGSTLVVAMEDPENGPLLEALERFTGFEVEPVIAFGSDIDDAVVRYYARSH